MCRELSKEKWVDAHWEDILGTSYFHIAFTIPEELNPIIYSNQKLLYDALYRVPPSTLRELASDSKHPDADIGCICTLHTWGGEVNLYPHTHAVVLDGGLNSKSHWRDNGEGFPLPTRITLCLFRGKYLIEPKHLWEDRKQFEITLKREEKRTEKSRK